MHHDPFSITLLQLALIIVLGMLGRMMAKPINQPAVLGELLAGVFLASLVRVTGGNLDVLIHGLSAYGELGLILLLMQVGLETEPGELLKVGKPAALIAVTGAFVPLVLGYLCAAWLTPAAGSASFFFVGATLSATSVAITTRVFRDLGRQDSPEAKTVLAASVLDDVIGLILLAVATSLATREGLDAGQVVKTLVIGSIFLGVIIFYGQKISRALIDNLSFLSPDHGRLLLPLCLCFLLSWLASVIGLAAVVGAFAAGLILKDEFFAPEIPGKIRGVLAPLEAFFTPVFFVLMGLQVDITALGRADVLALTIGLCVAAVAGKLACALVAGKAKSNPLVIAVGMLPRGEVGLIFAGAGRVLEVIDGDVFSALVITVILSTLITPPALKRLLEKAG